MFSRRKEYQPNGKFSTWLWRIALNLCYDELRRRRRRDESSVEEAGFGEASRRVGSVRFAGAGPDRQLAERERGECVRRALAQLPEMYRAVLVLRHYEDLKFREIAEVLDVPEGTVKSRMAEALTQMSRLLKPMLSEAGQEFESGQSTERKFDLMNHPTREEWMSYLYDELNGGECSGLAAHLRECPDCTAQVKVWETAREKLDSWRLPVKRARPAFAPAVWKWAAAAAVVLCIGFGVGRLTSPSVDVEEIRAAIEPEIRTQLRQEFSQMLHDEVKQAAAATLVAAGEQTQNLLADYDTALGVKRAADSQAIYAALEQLDAQRVADYILLKKDVDTVAVNTDASLRNTQQQLVQLADYSSPTPSLQPRN